VLLTLQHCARSRNRPTTTEEKTGKSLLCFGCDFSGWYNFGKIIKTVATRCHILKLKCTKFDFGWGFAPDPAGRDYSVPSEPLAGFKRPTLREMRQGKGMGRQLKERGKGEGKERKKGRGSGRGGVDIAWPDL